MNIVISRITACFLIGLSILTMTGCGRGEDASDVKREQAEVAKVFAETLAASEAGEPVSASFSLHVQAQSREIEISIVLPHAKHVIRQEYSDQRYIRSVSDENGELRVEKFVDADTESLATQMREASLENYATELEKLIGPEAEIAEVQLFDEFSDETPEGKLRTVIVMADATTHTIEDGGLFLDPQLLWQALGGVDEGERQLQKTAQAYSGDYENDPVFQTVRTIIMGAFAVDRAAVTPNAHLIKDFGLDRLNITDLAMLLEREYNIEIPAADAENFTTVGSVVNYVKERIFG